jgi:hypothetical protein
MEIPPRELIEARVDAYLRATGVGPDGCGDGQRDTVRRALADLPPQYTAADVAGCTAYFLDDWWWSQPGQLSPKKVAQTVPEWVAKGRPTWWGGYEPSADYIYSEAPGDRAAGGDGASPDAGGT